MSGRLSFNDRGQKIVEQDRPILNMNHVLLLWSTCVSKRAGTRGPLWRGTIITVVMSPSPASILELQTQFCISLAISSPSRDRLRDCLFSNAYELWSGGNVGILGRQAQSQQPSKGWILMLFLSNQRIFGEKVQIYPVSCAGVVAFLLQSFDGNIHGDRMMTMLRQYLVVKSSEPRHDHGSALDSIVRLRSVSVPRKTSTNTTGGNTVYLKIGLSIGIALLVAIAGVALLVARKRRQYRKVLAGLEKCGDICIRQETVVRCDPQPSSATRAEIPILTPSRASWTAISLDDAAHHAQDGRPAVQEVRPSKSSSATFMPQSMSPRRTQQVQRHKDSSHCTTQMPRPLIARRSSLEVKTNNPVAEQEHPRTHKAKAERVGKGILAVPEKLPPISPSFSGVSYPVEDLGIHAVQSGRQHVPRSLSLDSLATRGTYFKTGLNSWRLSRHGRSTSLGAPPTRPPSGPVPAVPNRAAPMKIDGFRRSLSTRRTFASKSNATHASAHANGLLMVPDVSISAHASRSLGSVAKTDSGNSDSVIYRQWQDPLVTGPQFAVVPSTESSNRQHRTVESTGSSSIVDRSTELTAGGHQRDRKTLSAAVHSELNRTFSTSTGDVSHNGKSAVFTTGMTSRNESYRPFRTMRPVNVGAASNGSPYEYKPLMTMGETSNSRLWRQTSSETEGSSGSGDGDNIGWSLGISRPSAMKGSPNARKGYRRRNTVRISTLTPQVFEVPTSQSANHGSARFMLEGLIEEKLLDTSAAATAITTLLRPNNNSFTDDRSESRVSRLSLTPSSPTLSAWVLHHKERSGLDGQTSGSASGTTSSLSSHPSSDLVIPEFPNPGKSANSVTNKGNTGLGRLQHVLATKVHRTGPQTPKSDILHLSSNTKVSSANGDKRHSTWNMITIPAVQQSKENEWEIPNWNGTDSKRGSPVSQAIADLRGSFYGQSYSRLPETSSSPVSLSNVSTRNTIEQLPANSKNVFYRPSQKPEVTSATSETFSEPSLNAHLVSPSLSPELQDAIVAPLDLPTIRRRAASISICPRDHLPFPPLTDPTAPTYVPLNVRTPLGSRGQPIKNSVESVTALHRMSSETVLRSDREAHNYSHIDSEASPFMPFAGESDHDFWLEGLAPSSAIAVGTTAVMDSDSYDGGDHPRRPVAELQHLLSAPYTLRMMPVTSFSRLQDPDISSDRQPSLPLPRDVLSRPPSMLPSMRTRPSDTMSPRQRLRFPRAKGDTATPRSLYDADGFLVSGS
nr:hypothetical protein CFP56_46802 [Quercus suber]